MNRVIAGLVIALAIAGLVLKSWWLPSIAAQDGYLGYVEGETTLIAAPSAGRLVARPVERGANVKAGDPLFTIDTASADAEVARAAATVNEARAALENLRTGRRKEEQDIVRAQRREAEAALRLAERDLVRMTELVPGGAVSRARFDQSSSQVEQLKARVEQLKAQETANELGGRSAELAAAEARVAQLIEALNQARSRQFDLAPHAPADAEIDDTFFDVGEWVGAGQPVVSLLPSDRVKLRFFVPQSDLARAQPGTVISFRCDGCAADQTATINYVAPRAEFTPPVIYSQSARQKLVFLVEARPAANANLLQPGLPITVNPFKSAQP